MVEETVAVPDASPTMNIRVMKLKLSVVVVVLGVRGGGPFMQDQALIVSALLHHCIHFESLLCHPIT